MSINEYEKLSTDQLKELLSKNIKGEEKENIINILQKKRANELLNNAEKFLKKDDEQVNTQNQEDGDCFIATACYGNPDHQSVKIFREWRDIVLVTSVHGKALVLIYYLVAPHISRILKFSPCAMWLTREKLLEPLARHLGNIRV